MLQSGSLQTPVTDFAVAGILDGQVTAMDVLDRGDEWAMHVGATGGLRLGAMDANPAGPGDLPPQDRGWLADHGIEWKPDDAG